MIYEEESTDDHVSISPFCLSGIELPIEKKLEEEMNEFVNTVRRFIQEIACMELQSTLVFSVSGMTSMNQYGDGLWKTSLIGEPGSAVS